MNPNTNTNYLTNGLQAAQRFAGQVLSAAESGISRKPWGRYATEYGSVGETIKKGIQTKQIAAPSVAAAAALDVLTNETRKEIGRAHV